MKGFFLILSGIGIVFVLLVVFGYVIVEVAGTGINDSFKLSRLFSSKGDRDFKMKVVFGKPKS